MVCKYWKVWFVHLLGNFWVILIAVGVSLSLELGQLIFRLGLFEFDDMFHNTLGAVLGYGLWRMWRRGRLGVES